MKRTSYSIHRCNSALYGVPVVLKDRLHANLLTFADTEPGLLDYCVYAPSFIYNNRSGEKESCYVISAKFDDGHAEVWASSWELEPNSDSALEQARQGQAKSLGATYHLFTAKAFAASPIELKNRQTMQAVLFKGGGFDTTALEESLDAMLSGTSLSFAALAEQSQRPLLQVELASFRLLRDKRLKADMASRYISPSFQISGGCHA